MVKKKIDSYQWKIIIQIAIEEIGLFKNKNNKVYTNRKIKKLEN